MTCTIGIDVHTGRADFCLLRAGRPAQIAQAPVDPTDPVASLLAAIARLAPPPRHTLILCASLPEPEQTRFEREARTMGTILIRTMQDNGGCIGTDIARLPGVLSSPCPGAAAVIAAWRTAQQLGQTRLVTCDWRANEATLCFCDGQLDSPLDSRGAAGPPRLDLRRVALPHDAPAALHEIAEASRSLLEGHSIAARECVLAACGLRGALHAAHLAERLDLSTVMIPVFAGVAGAVGAALADLRIDVAADLPPHTTLDPAEPGIALLVQTALLDSDIDLPPVPPGLVALRAAFASLLEHAARLVQFEGFEQDDVIFDRYLDAAFAGSDAVFTISADWLADVPRLLAPLHIAWRARFNAPPPSCPVELRRAYVRAVRTTELPPPLAAAPTIASLDDARLDNPTDLNDWPIDAAAPLPLYDRTRLSVGIRLPGPAMIREPYATTHVPPGWTAEVTPSLALLLRR